MANFEYIALNGAGQRVTGALAGSSEAAILAELEARALTPVRVTETAAAAGNATSGMKAWRARLLSWRTPKLGGPLRLKPRVLGQAYAQIADLLHAGVPLLRALRLLGNRRSTPALGAAFTELAEAVARGEELHVALGKRPEAFPPVHVAMVRAGEKGGFLEAIFARLGQLVLNQAELRGKVVSALVYPAVICGLGVIILSGIFGFLVPMFRPIFERAGNLPLVTRVVFAVSDAIQSYGLVLLVAVAAGAAASRPLLRKPEVRHAWERVRTLGPAIGPLTRALATARFCRMLGTMLGNSVPMLTALTIAKDAAGNQLLGKAIDEAADAVRAGQGLAGPLAQSGLFAPEVIEVISVGESANNLDAVLLTVAETTERNIDRLLQRVVVLVQPLVLVLLGAVIGVIALALVLPMVTMSVKL